MKLEKLCVENWQTGEKLTADLSKTAPVEVVFYTDHGALSVRWNEIRGEVVVRNWRLARVRLDISPINTGTISVRLEAK